MSETERVGRLFNAWIRLLEKHYGGTVTRTKRERAGLELAFHEGYRMAKREQRQLTARLGG